MNIVKRIRGADGDSREQFAEKLNVSYSTIRRWETNPLPPPEIAAEIIQKTGATWAIEDYAEQVKVSLRNLVGQREMPRLAPRQ